MRKLIVPNWKLVLNKMGYNSSGLSEKQLKEIRAQRTKTEAGSNDNSGGSAAGGSTEGHDNDHDHWDVSSVTNMQGMFQDPGDHSFK